METVDCNLKICKTCLENTDRFDFSEVELRVWEVLSFHEKKISCNLLNSDKHTYFEEKRKEHNII